jgi:hypothetical protein
MAQKTTTSQGGVFHMNSSRKAAAPNAKSPALVIAEVQTGRYSAASKSPTTAALTPQHCLRPRAPAQLVPERQWTDDEQEGGQKHGDEAEDRARPSVRRRMHDRSEIGGEREQRAGHRLRRAITGEESIVADPAGRHHGGLQQREHNVTAAEHQRARAIERIE